MSEEKTNIVYICQLGEPATCKYKTPVKFSFSYCGGNDLDLIIKECNYRKVCKLIISPGSGI